MLHQSLRKTRSRNSPQKMPLDSKNWLIPNLRITEIFARNLSIKRLYCLSAHSWLKSVVSKILHILNSFLRDLCCTRSAEPNTYTHELILRSLCTVRMTPVFFLKILLPSTILSRSAGTGFLLSVICVAIATLCYASNQLYLDFFVFFSLDRP